MRHSLWMVNSALLILFGVVLLAYFFLRTDARAHRRVRIATHALPDDVAPVLSEANIRKIFLGDLFDTYTPPMLQEGKPELIPPLPSLHLPSTPPSRKAKTPSLLEPLEVKLNGIIYSDTSPSIALLEDEAGKEVAYHIGEKIKDAQLVRIVKNRIVLLRSNGQQEDLYLNKEEEEQSGNEKRWAMLVKRLSPGVYHLDPQRFSKEIQTLGNLLEQLGAFTAYENDKPIGVHLGELEPDSLGAALGLASNDIVLSVNETSLATVDGRLEALHLAQRAELGDVLKVHLAHGGSKEILQYKLAKIKEKKVPPFSSGPPVSKKAEEAGVFKLSREQEFEKKERQFKAAHSPPEREETASEIKNRLLDNLKQRRRAKRDR